MKFKLLACLDFAGNELDDAHWSQLNELSEKRVITNKDTLTSKHTQADALLVKLGVKVPQDLIDTLPNLKYIGMLGTGFGGIDTEHAAKKDITVTNIADYATEGVAEFTFGILINHLRNLHTAADKARKSDYSDEGYNGSEIKGKQFGVIGLGAIGNRTAELASAFGASVQYWSRRRKSYVETENIKHSKIDELLKTSDIITLNLAYNPGTENFLNADRIAIIKSGAVVINPSPMELVDFEALVERLKKGDITFMLDHTDEITQEQLDTLQPLKNCIMYPPIAYLTQEATDLKRHIYVDNVKNFLAGKPTNKVH